MTVSTTSPRTVSYAGDGGSGPFAVPFRVLEATDLKAAILTEDGTRTVLEAFTVTGAGELSGAAVTTADPVAVGETLVLWTETALVQPADYLAGDAFPAETHEAALDRLTLIAQDARRDINRAVLVAIGETPPTYDQMIDEAASQVGAAAVALVNDAGAAQVTLVNDAGSTQVGLVNAAGSAQLSLVEDEGRAQIALVEAAGDAKIAELATAPTANVKAYASTAAGISAGDLFFCVPMAYSKAARVYENVGGVATYRQTVPWLGGYLYPAAIAQQRAFGAPESLISRDGLFWFNCLHGWDSDKQWVPNALDPSNVSNNLLFFSSGYTGSVTNATTTVKAGTGPGGGQTAAQLAYNNGATVSIFGPLVLPADNYVFTYKARNVAVGTIPLRHGKTNATASYTTDNIDNTAFVAITDNFTADGSSSYSYGIGNNSGSAQTILVDEMQLCRASDGAPVTFSTEKIDTSLRRTIRTPNSLNITPELLDVTTTGQVYHAKLPDFPGHTALEGVTLYFAMRSTGNTDNRALILAPGDASQPVHTTNGYNRFRFGPRYTTGQVRSYLELVAPGIAYEAYADMEAYDDTLQVVVASFGASGVVFTVDGFLVGPYEQGQTLTSPMAEAFIKFFGSQNASQNPPATETVMPVKFAMAGMEKKQITAGKARIMTDRMKRALASTGLKIVDSPTVTLTEGDSELHGNPRETNSTPAHMLRRAVSPTAWVVTMGLAGSVLGYPGDTNYLSMYARLPRLLENLTRAFNDGRSVRLVGQIGANDYARIISSGSGYATAILAYLGVIRAHWISIGGDPADLIILWGDVLPRGNALGWNLATTFNPARAITNADLAAAVGGGIIDGLIPMGSHPIMGPDAAVDDPALYDPDKLHGTRPYGAGLLLASVVDVWEPTLV